MLQQPSNPCILSEPWAIWGSYCREPQFIVLVSEVTRTPFGGGACFTSWKELGAGHERVPVPLPARRDFGKGEKPVQCKDFKCAQPSLPPELIWSIIYAFSS